MDVVGGRKNADKSRDQRIRIDCQTGPAGGWVIIIVEEGEGGARPPRPQLLPATHPPVLKPLNLGSSLYSTPLPDTKTTLYTTPPHHRGLPPGAATPPLSLPTRGFRNNSGLDLSGLGVLALPPPDPPYVAMRLDCGGQPPHTWHDDLCGFLKLCFSAVWTGENQRPRAFGLSSGPRSSFGGELWWPNYGPNRFGRSVYGAYPFLLCSRGVSVSV